MGPDCLREQKALCCVSNTATGSPAESPSFRAGSMSSRDRADHMQRRDVDFVGRRFEDGAFEQRRAVDRLERHEAPRRLIFAGCLHEDDAFIVLMNRRGVGR